MVSFNDEASLGQVIEKKQMFSFGAAPIQQFKEIVFAAGGNKFSSLCGFKFTSKANTEYKEFFISFVCKLRSKIYRQSTTNPSQWFIFKKISGKELHCMDKESMLAQYGFDVDLFFKSDLFEQGVKKFKQAIDKGLKDYVPAYVKAHGAEKAKSMLTSYDGQNNATVADAVGRYTKAIEDSLEYIGDLRCNDKFYKLIDYGITVEKDSDEVVQEANFECEVKKENDGWAIYEKDGHLWVATFHDEIAANEFAKEYPKLKAEYLKKAAAIEAENSLVEDDNSDGAKIDESQKALTVKDVLDDINQWVDEDNAWLEAKLYVNAPDGNTYETSYVAASDDIDSGALVLELGKKYKAPDRFHGRRRPPFEAEDEEKKKDEEELDGKIEEALKDIYK